MKVLHQIYRVEAKNLISLFEKSLEDSFCITWIGFFLVMLLPEALLAWFCRCVWFSRQHLKVITYFPHFEVRVPLSQISPTKSPFLPICIFTKIVNSYFQKIFDRYKNWIPAVLLLQRIFFESACIKFSKWGKIDFSRGKFYLGELHSENGWSPWEHL